MGEPTPREYEDLRDRMRQAEKDIEALKIWQARARGAASILGFIAGLISAAVVTAIVRAMGFGN